MGANFAAAAPAVADLRSQDSLRFLRACSRADQKMCAVRGVYE